MIVNLVYICRNLPLDAMLTFWHNGSLGFPAAKDIQTCQISDNCKVNLRKMKIVALAVKDRGSVEDFLKANPMVNRKQAYTTIVGKIGKGIYSVYCVLLLASHAFLYQFFRLLSCKLVSC
jgi:hypothetical protein